MEASNSTIIGMQAETGTGEEKEQREEWLEMSPEEADLIHRLHRLLGDRWALIAGRLPNRKAEEVEKYWKFKERKNMECKIYKPICIRLSPSFKFSVAQDS